MKNTATIGFVRREMIKNKYGRTVMYPNNRSPLKSINGIISTQTFPSKKVLGSQKKSGNNNSGKKKSNGANTNTMRSIGLKKWKKLDKIGQNWFKNPNESKKNHTKVMQKNSYKGNANFIAKIHNAKVNAGNKLRNYIMRNT